MKRKAGEESPEPSKRDKAPAAAPRKPAASKAPAAPKKEKKEKKELSSAAKSLATKALATAATTSDATGKVFVFTGFRSEALKAALEAAGGTVRSSMTSLTTSLVRKVPGGGGLKGAPISVGRPGRGPGDFAYNDAHP